MGCGLSRLGICTADKLAAMDGKPQPSSDSIVHTREGGRESVFTIIHFNDVYNIEERKKEPVGGASRFKTRLDSLQELRPLVLFSGDALNPSNSKPCRERASAVAKAYFIYMHVLHGTTV